MCDISEGDSCRSDLCARDKNKERGKHGGMKWIVVGITQQHVKGEDEKARTGRTMIPNSVHLPSIMNSLKITAVCPQPKLPHTHSRTHERTSLHMPPHQIQRHPAQSQL